jgi:hypothetical protein
MATVIGIMGESGHGKTTSIRNLDPKKTFYIDADGKGLSFKGWKKMYNHENKNYAKTSNIESIKAAFSKVDKDFKQFEVLIVDTVNAIMLDSEMERMKEKGYDKWIDLAQFVYGLIKDAHSLRNDLYVVFIFHVAIDSDDYGNRVARILTNGRKLEKIKLESKLTNLLYAKCVDGKYVFETQAKNSTAKSMMGLFETFEIDNDLNFVIESIKKYEQGE